MTTRRLITTLLAAVAIFSATAAQPTADVARKAERFFSQHEWASAMAMYGLLISEKPTDINSYAHAIVAAGMLDARAEQLDLTTRAIHAAVPFDSLFARVERISFSLAQTSLYRDYLLRVRDAQPWMARHINGQLLRYYTYRRDPAGMIAYSRLMLDGMPGHTAFLYPLAQELLLRGQPEEAMKVYTEILTAEPHSLEALLYLGNYFADRAPTHPADRQIARDYLERAAALRPTPYLASRLSRL